MNAKLNEQLFNVVLDNKSSFEVKCKKINYLVYLGADVNGRNKNGESVLFKGDDLVMMKFLVGLFLFEP